MCCFLICFCFQMSFLETSKSKIVKLKKELEQTVRLETIKKVVETFTSILLAPELMTASRQSKRELALVLLDGILASHVNFAAEF